jgi:hypothetical protein
MVQLFFISVSLVVMLASSVPRPREGNKLRLELVFPGGYGETICRCAMKAMFCHCCITEDFGNSIRCKPSLASLCNITLYMSGQDSSICV